MIEELVAKVFAARNAAHLEHWATSSFAQHMALGNFYDEVIEVIDKLVESYQGNFSKIKRAPLKDESGEIIDILEDQAIWIGEHRREIARGVAALENIVDELTHVYLSTIYKLRNLK